MADVDPSIALRAGQQPNILETLGNVANTAGAINQNRLFQQTFRSNQAISRIYQEAIDENGNIDTDKLKGLLASDPTISLGLPAALKGAQDLRHQQLGIGADQLKLAQAHYGAMADRFSSLAAQPGLLTTKDMVQASGAMIRDGLADPSQVSSELANLADRLRGATTPQQQDGVIRQFLTELHLSTMDAAARLNAISPAPTPVGLGGSTGLLKLPQAGTPSMVGNIPNTLPATTPIFQPGSTTPTYAGGLATGGQAAAGPTTATGGPPPGAPGTVAAGLPAGAGEALNVQGHNSAQMGVNLTNAADRVPMMKATLSNLDQLATEFTPGPGSHSWKEFGAGLNMIAQSMGLQGFDASGIASQEDFDKQASMVAGEQFNMLGGTGTDAKLDAARTVSPNSYLSGQGNHRIIALLKGNADALQAKARAWNDWSKTHGPQSYGDFSTDFNKIYDPRVFQFQYLKPAERKDALDHMDLAERQQFVRSYNMAIDNGWVPPLKKK